MMVVVLVMMVGVVAVMVTVMVVLVMVVGVVEVVPVTAWSYKDATLRPLVRGTLHTLATCLL